MESLTHIIVLIPGVRKTGIDINHFICYNKASMEKKFTDFEIEEKTTEETAASTVDKSDSSAPQNEEKEEKKSDYSVFDLTQLVSKLEVLTKHDNWYNHGKEIQEITYQYELKFKKEIQAKKEDFINEGGNEIDFYFRPSHKNEFDQILRDYKKKKRNYFQEREQAQKLNLDRKLEIIEGLKNLINGGRPSMISTSSERNFSRLVK